MTKRTGFFLFAAAAAGFLALQAADYKGPHAERDQKDIIQLEKQWAEALQTRDTATLDRILADDYTFVDSSGKTTTKAQEIDMHRSGNLKFDSVSTGDQQIKVYIGGAVVTGTTTVKGKYKNEDISGDYRFVDLLERRKSGWQAVFSQITKVQTEKDKKKATK